MRRLLRDDSSRAAFRHLLRLNTILICCVLWPVVVLHASVPVKAPSKVEVLGSFSSINHDPPEDAFGYALKLWKDGDQIFGLLVVYTGPPADPPTGILEDVKFDSRTRHLSFSARLSTGLLYAREYRGVPSRDRFKFEGVLTRRQVTGTLSRSDDLLPDTRPTTKRIRLRWSSLLTEVMIPPPATYSDWKTWADEILKRRGPKW